MTRVIVTRHFLESIRADLEALKARATETPHCQLMAIEVSALNVGRINGVLEFGRPKEKEV